MPLGSADWENEFLLVVHSVMIFVCNHCSKLSLHQQSMLERCCHLILLNYINIWEVIFLISTTSIERWEIVALLRKNVVLIKLQRRLLHIQIEKQNCSAEQNYSLCTLDSGICYDHRQQLIMIICRLFPKIKNILGNLVFLYQNSFVSPLQV